MGMPGSETALEEMMCLVLGDNLQDGTVPKLTVETSLMNSFNWERVLQAIQKCNLRLSPTKTVIYQR